MALYDSWKKIAFDARGQAVQSVWEDYLEKEKKVYKRILLERLLLIEGTVTEIGEKLNLNTTHMAAFIDGIYEAVDGLPPVGEVEADTKIKIEIDLKRLYKQMVEYKADDLYTLPEWNNIFTKEQQKEYYTEQKKSHTVVKGTKIGRNDPCPCGSNKKYKKCCS